MRSQQFLAACLITAFLFLPRPYSSLAQELPALGGPDEIPSAEFGITDFYYDSVEWWSFHIRRRERFW